MTRWLFIILAVIVGWFLPTAAHAHARVAQAAYDAGPVVEKVVLVAGITMDTYEGDDEDPLSLHKYLYCKDNVINGIDPSGKITIFQAIGVLAVFGALAVVYAHYFYDNSPNLMHQIPQATIIAEYSKQDHIIGQLIDAAQDASTAPEGHLKPLDSYGIGVGGRLGTITVDLGDPEGQKIRNIWESPKTEAGKKSAGEELSVRIHAGFGKGKEEMVKAMADPAHFATSSSQYVALLVALQHRQEAYKAWLATFITTQPVN